MKLLFLLPVFLFCACAKNYTCACIYNNPQGTNVNTNYTLTAQRKADANDQCNKIKGENLYDQCLLQ